MCRPLLIHLRKGYNAISLVSAVCPTDIGRTRRKTCSSVRVPPRSGQLLGITNTLPKATRQFTLMDRKITTEFLELYKDSPCLWYQAHPLYTNRDAREQAYEVLLEKYRIIQENANLEMVKKKIDNMRTTYKRERKKVKIKFKFKMASDCRNFIEKHC